MNDLKKSRVAILKVTDNLSGEKFLLKGKSRAVSYKFLLKKHYKIEPVNIGVLGENLECVEVSD